MHSALSFTANVVVFDGRQSNLFNECIVVLIVFNAKMKPSTICNKCIYYYYTVYIIISKFMKFYCDTHM